MAILGEAVVKIKASLEPLKKSLKSAKSMTTKAVSGLTSGLVSGMSSALSKIGGIIKKVAKLISVTLVAAFGLAIREAVKFQKQMAEVNTMLDDDSGPMMEQFSKSLSQMSKQFGQSTATLSKGLYDILSASIPAEKALGVLEVSARAAIAGVTDTGVAADVITTIINSYGMAAEDASEISDKLFATVKRGKTTFPELAQSLGRVTSTASIAGMSLDELLSIVATLTRSGIQTTEAVTSINGVLRAFLSPQDTAIEAAEEFGLELSSNTLKTMGFLEAIKKLNGAEAEQLAAIVPNIRAFKALAGALNNVTGLQTDLGLISSESAGKTSEAFDKMASTTSFALGQMKETVKSAGRAFAEPLFEPLDALIQKINMVVSALEMFFRDNAALIKQWGEDASAAIDKVAAYFGDLLAIVMDEGWGAAFTKLGTDILNALETSLDYIMPIAKDVGREMAMAFKEEALPSLTGALKWLAIDSPISVIGGMRRGVETAGEFFGGNSSETGNRTEALLVEIRDNTRKSPLGAVGE